MTLRDPVLFSLGRALVVVALAVPAAAPVGARLRGERAGLWWAAVLAPLLVPELLTGYGWSNFALSLAANPRANELLTAALIWGRCVCAAAALLAVAPAATRTASAVFLRKLIPVTPRPGRASALQDRMLFWREATLRTAERFGPAAGLTGLFALGQFEVPSLAGTTAWTVSLFDAHASLERLSDSLRLAAPAALVQAVGLAPLLVWSRRARGPRDDRRTPGSTPAAAVALTAAVGLTVVVPAGIVAWEAGAGGWRELARSGWRLDAFARECGLSLATGAAAAALAGGVLCAVGKVRGPAGSVLLAACVLPGLCGPLVVALCVQAVVTWAAANRVPGAFAVRDSVGPLVVALALFLLPRAAVLRAFAGGNETGVHLARVLRGGTRSQRRSGGRVWWGLVGRAAWVRWGLLTIWAAADVSAAAVLLPAGVETAPPGLYNLMHYGHNGVLGALCLLNTLLPAAVLALGAWGLPRVAAWGASGRAGG